MNVLSCAALFVLIYSACFCTVAFANDAPLVSPLVSPIVPPTVPPNSNDKLVPASAGANFTAEMRLIIKREVMSKPGVLLDMANMTDNGYTWINDVVWAGSSVTAAQSTADTMDGSSANLQWYIAGFMFQRPRYKGVWLQYAFTLSESTGEIANFRRWYGNETFR